MIIAKQRTRVLPAFLAERVVLGELADVSARALRISTADGLIEEIEVVHTPKHGSWLNMAECGLSVLEKQVLGERVESEAALRERADVWNADRNRRSKGINWRFKTSDARIKPRRPARRLSRVKPLGQGVSVRNATGFTSRLACLKSKTKPGGDHCYMRGIEGTTSPSMVAPGR
ncbi:MAG: hypothetical protein GY842_16725 [bacterium]|nr:hypothetical protein [bacterium]